jgi:hypothetical protein
VRLLVAGVTGVIGRLGEQLSGTARLRRDGTRNLAAGVFGYAVEVATRARGRASNARARRELGWESRYASWRDGFREALG